MKFTKCDTIEQTHQRLPARDKYATTERAKAWRRAVAIEPRFAQLSEFVDAPNDSELRTIDAWVRKFLALMDDCPALEQDRSRLFVDLLARHLGGAVEGGK